ncbi:hypothetical protein BKA83DRAFT_1432233 [Pisolithus microcarpus]|nr:hypothetical protein BKA83DRAFT_1432233 [Pisolithus microcarpus]
MTVSGSFIEDDESTWGRLRECHSCGYSFCSVCKRTWHGPHTPCPLPVTSKIILAYLAASEDERIRLERHYGRTSVQRMVRQHKEDEENRKWLESSTTECPGCALRVEKSMGCNHMTCSKCKTHFCYRCGHRISATNPYQHSSTPGSSCFSRLFDFVPRAEGGWQPIEASDFPEYGYSLEGRMSASVFHRLIARLIVAYSYLRGGILREITRPSLQTSESTFLLVLLARLFGHANTQTPKRLPR